MRYYIFLGITISCLRSCFISCTQHMLQFHLFVYVLKSNFEEVLQISNLDLFFRPFFISEGSGNHGNEWFWKGH